MKFEYTRAATTARWAGDFIGADSLVPFPAKVDAATVAALADGRKFVPSGTPVGRTFIERDANAPFGLAADADDEMLLTARDIYDAAKNNDVELYRPGRVVKENFLPAFQTMSAAIKAKIRSLYITETGVE